MKRVSTILLLMIIGLISCKPQKEQAMLDKSAFTKIVTDEYELYKPDKEIKAILILFGGFTEDPEDIKREFKILDIASKNSIAVLLSSFNKKLWLEENEKHQLAKSLQHAVKTNQLPQDNIFIGGFSSGGLVGLFMSDFLAERREFSLHPKGVFAVDSPVDLAGIYTYCEKRLEQMFSEPAIQESTFLLT